MSKTLLSLAMLASLVASIAPLSTQQAMASNSRSGARSRATTSGPPATVLQIYNKSNSSVTTDLKVIGTDAGCPVAIANVNVLDAERKIIPLSQLGDDVHQGFFTLPQGATYTVEPKTGTCLQAVIVTFAAPPQCPCTGTCSGFVPFVPGPNLPDGVNSAEVTLNPPTGNPQFPNQETVDISCINGVNTEITMDFNGGGPVWNDGTNTYNTFKITNAAVDVAGQIDYNCANGVKKPGVYPYNATRCNLPNNSQFQAACPPSPTVQPFCFPSAAECNLQRAPVNGQFGGTVRVIYDGPIGIPL